MKKESVQAFPLFKGATRVPLFLGVPMMPLMLMVMSVGSFAMLFSLWLGVLMFPLWGIMAAITKKDDRAFRKWGLFLSTTFINKNKKFWKGSSYGAGDYSDRSKTFKKLKSENLKRLAHENSVSDYVPYSHHVTDTIIATRGGEYVSVFKIEGRSHESASNGDLSRWVQNLNQLLIGVGTEHISLWSHILRVKAEGALDAKFNNVFCKQIDQDYKKTFQSAGLMVNELYLSVVYRPITDEVLKQLSKTGKLSIEQKKQQQAKAIKILSETNQLIQNALKHYQGVLLGLEEKNGHTFSKAASFFYTLLNAEKEAFPVTKEKLYSTLPASRIIFSQWGEVGEIRSTNQTKSFGMLEVLDYDEQTEPGELNTLYQAPYEFVLTQSFSCLSKAAAKGFLKKHQKFLSDSNDLAYSQIEEIDEALNDLISNRFVMGEHHATLQVFGENTHQVRDYLSKARSSLMESSVATAPCDLSLEAAFWSQLPGNFKYRPRPKAITSLNFLSFSPFHNYMTGKPHNNPWGDAVTVLKSASRTPYYFNFHYSPPSKNSRDVRLPGNTAIIGQTGAGKTVLLGFLISQAQKFKPKTVIFDKDRGLEIAVRAMGGQYLTLKKGQPSGLNPFQLEANPSNKSFLRAFIKKLASTKESLNHKDEQAIDQAVDALFDHIDLKDRSLSTLLQLLPNPIEDEGRAHVHSKLLKWSASGSLGWLFDNEKDELDFKTHQMYGFDVTDFLDDPEIRTPIAMYILHRTESMIDGNPFMYVGDELWKLLLDPYFEALFQNKQKTNRKENGIFVFATQEPNDILKSPIASTLIQQCVTKVFLPNPAASEEDYIHGFKLNQTEFERVRSLTPESRQFLVKQGEGASLAELDLSGMEDALLILSGTPDRAQKLEELIIELGTDDPKVWLPVFVKRFGRGVAA